MADFSKPNVSSTKVGFPDEIRAANQSLAKMFDGTSDSNIPTNAKRINNGTGEVFNWNGSSWSSIGFIALTRNPVADLIDGAPAALDTLNELAAALNDDANFSSTVTNSINSLQSQVNQQGNDIQTLQNTPSAAGPKIERIFKNQTDVSNNLITVVTQGVNVDQAVEIDFLLRSSDWPNDIHEKIQGVLLVTRKSGESELKFSGHVELTYQSTSLQFSNFEIIGDGGDHSASFGVTPGTAGHGSNFIKQLYDQNGNNYRQLKYHAEYAGSLWAPRLKFEANSAFPHFACHVTSKVFDNINV